MRIEPENVGRIAPGPPARRGRAWVERLRSGDGDALEQWVGSRAGRLLQVARRFLRDEADSQDVVREVMLRALQALSDGEVAAVSWSWLRQQTLEAALARLRSRSPGPGSIDALLPRFRADGTHAEAPGPWRTDGGLGRDPAAFSSAVRDCIDRLPEPHRAVLMASDGERLDARSIGRHLAMSEDGVKTVLHEARLALRTQLDPLMRSEASAASRDARR
ncbi:MAG: RNA polymerase sigma factor [Myxococcota bacterium]